MVNMKRLQHDSIRKDLAKKMVPLIEATQSETEISPSLRYFHQKYGIPAMQFVRYLRQERLVEGIELRRAFDYLRGLAM